MAFCGQCGAKILEGAKFCMACGAKVVDEQSIDNSVELQKMAPNETDTSQYCMDNATANVSDNPYQNNKGLDEGKSKKRKKEKKKIGPVRRTIDYILLAAIIIFCVITLVSKFKRDKAYENLSGTWEHTISINVLKNEGYTLYLDCNLQVTFYKDGTGSLKIIVGNSADELSGQVSAVAREAIIDMFEEEGISNYYSYVSPNGYTFSAAVKMFEDEITSYINQVIAESKNGESTEFEYRIAGDTINYSGGFFGEYYIASDVLYVKGGAVDEFYDSFELKALSGYASFKKVR